MGYIKDLYVDKVSLVSNPATGKKFLLLKSADGRKDGNDRSEGKKGVAVIKLQKDVREALTVLVRGVLKKGQKLDSADVVSVLEKKFELDEDAKTSIKRFVEFSGEVGVIEKKVVTDPPPTSPKSSDGDDVKALNKANETLTKANKILTKAVETSQEAVKNLEKRVETQENQSLIQKAEGWLRRNARAAVENIEEKAKELVELEKVSKSASTTLKESLKKASKLIENSDSFISRGSGGPGNPSGDQGIRLVKSVDDALEERGSDVSHVDAASQAVLKSPDAYKKYHLERRERSRRNTSTIAAD